MNLIKLSVGSESVETLTAWQEMRRTQSSDGQVRHVTRMWPKREAEIVADGSIYWVIKGAVQCRQRILRFDEIIGEDGIRRCGLVLAPKIHRTQSALRRPFQGWRYLKPEDSPLDLREGQTHQEALPHHLNQALAEIGVL